MLLIRSRQMPALKPRESLTNGKQSKVAGQQSAQRKMSSSAFSSSSPAEATTSNGYAKKKLMFLEEQQQQNGTHFCDKNNNSNEDEKFADVCTVSEAHANQDQDGPQIFGRNSNGSINQTAKDQFAAALLRLQADLDSTSKRLSELEVKLDKQAGKQQASGAGRATGAGGKGAAKGYFSRDNLASVVYLGWPVLVFLAIRAFERRSLAARGVTA